MKAATITEGVVGLSPEQVDEITNLIHKATEKYRSADALEKHLNPQLKAYNIVLTRDDPVLKQYGSPGGFTGQSVALNTNQVVGMGPTSLRDLIAHETVHGEQMRRAKETGANPPELIQKILGYVAPGGHLDMARYHNHPLEQAAYARNAVDRAHAEGADLEKLLRYGGILGYSMSHPTDRARFLRYAWMWATKLGYVSGKGMTIEPPPPPPPPQDYWKPARRPRGYGHGPGWYGGGSYGYGGFGGHGRAAYGDTDDLDSPIEGLPELPTDPRQAVMMAEYEIGPWPEAEPVIAQDPICAFRYAVRVLGDRFPAGEPAIAQDPRSAYVYAREVLHTRFSEAEPTIKNSIPWAYYYARDVIHGPWPEAGILEMPESSSFVNKALDHLLEAGELEPDFDSFKDLHTSSLPEDDVRWWSRYAWRMHFKSDAEAREWVFHKLEQWDTEFWISAGNGPKKNRSIANLIPVYRDRYDRWRVGHPLSFWRGKVHEYLSNNTSDFSDGTSGEPSSAAPSTGDLNSQAGLPDYKYLDRLKARRQKQRGKQLRVEDLEVVPQDGQIWQVLTEGKTLGFIQSEAAKTGLIPTLAKLRQDFPWLAVPAADAAPARYATREEALTHFTTKLPILESRST